MATAGAVVRPDTDARTDVEGRQAVRREARRVEVSAVKPAAETRTFSGEDRYRMIAEAAYFRAESRGFEHGSDLDDWLSAEVEIDELFGEVGSAANA